MGEVLWSPPPDVRQTSELGRFLDFVRDTRGRDLPGYDELFDWSVSDLEGFWGSLWDYYEVKAHTPYERVLGATAMPGAEWFTGATLNYAEHMVGREEDLADTAVLAISQTRDPFELSFADLREQVGAARAGLQRLGERPRPARAGRRSRARRDRASARSRARRCRPGPPRGRPCARRS